MALTTGLIAYYKMDEGSGTQASDATGNGNNALTVGASIWSTSGKINDCTQYDGATNYLNCGTNILFSTNSKFSVSAWVYYNDFNSYHDIFTKNVQNMFIQTLIATDVGPGRIRLCANGAVNLNSISAFGTGSWNHLVGVYDQTKAYIYMNGTLDNSVSNTGAITDSGSALIGSYDGAQQFMSGRIDEVGVWNRDLSAAEVSQLYSSGNGFQYPFTVLNGNINIAPSINLLFNNS